MSQENVDLVRMAFAEIGRLLALSTVDPETPLGDEYAQMRRLLDPQFELVPAAAAVERRTLRGPDGFVTFLEGGRDTWRNATLEAEEFVDVGDRVLGDRHLSGQRTIKRSQDRAAQRDSLEPAPWAYRQRPAVLGQTRSPPSRRAVGVGDVAGECGACAPPD
jgi:hypothetical protein